ncbi:hypothetical protein BDE02_07G011700 [Populus trichocarpa]|nr:hypothetical protein BDE02_07G011700 [Populus trichocarpa]
MPHTTTPLPSKTGIQLEDVESAAKPQRIKPTDYTDNNINQDENKRLKDVEISVPVVYGTMAFYLGKKANEFHLLKLYPDAESGPQSTKKPVVVETYNEIVFPDPSENFLARVLNHPAVYVPRLPAGFNLPAPVPSPNMNVKGKDDTKNHPLNHWFINFSEADELLKLASARQQVQDHILKLRRQLSMLDGPPQPSKLAYGMISECT